MKGKIDKQGYLWIERRGIMTLQYCPFKTRNKPYTHFCPLFRESASIQSTTVIAICNGIYHAFDTFTDEREEESDE